MLPIVIHISKNSPKRPGAKVSIYAQRYRQGISWKMFGTSGALLRQIYSSRSPGIYYRNGTVHWVRYLAVKDRRMRSKHS